MYALAALRISQTRFGFDLDSLEEARVAAGKEVEAEVLERDAPQKPAQQVTNDFLSTTGDSPWL